PLGACLASEEAASGMGPGSHGTTYGGNHLAMAVGNAVLDEILAPGFLAHVRDIGEELGAALDDFARTHPDQVVEPRGTGLMRGLKLAAEFDPRAVMRKALEKRLLIVPAGDNVIRLLPPLICEREHVEEAMKRLGATLAG
ncbi:MAG: aminotransferase class III-fold pyridoxal phosphate-dependent enzyme, partial [Alphaproteobacteria bacterium]